MKNQQTQYILSIALTASLALLQGCATSHSRLSADGKSDQIVFPNVEKDAWNKEGSFPNLDNLRNVGPDMTKTQLYRLLGTPHFSEGLVKVREWDYIFNFRNNDSNTVETCQYKVIYSPDMRLQNTYWKPASCAEHLAKPELKPEQIVVERIVEKIAPGVEVTKLQTKMQMSADGLFEFDKSGITNLRPGGIEKLDRLSANLLSNGEITQLKIVGHTDRLGNDDYNMKLSEARAETIRQYLVAKNIPAERILTAGAGKSTPLVDCKQNKRDESLIRCLEANRRFEIEAWTTSKM